MRKYLAYYETEWPANIAELTAVENKPFVGYLKGEGMKYTVIPQPVTGPADNEIWYTSNDNNKLTWWELNYVPTEQTATFGGDDVDVFYTPGDPGYERIYGYDVLYHDFDNDKNCFVLKFDKPLTETFWKFGSVNGANATIVACGQNITSFILPNSVNYILDIAFYGCDSLTSIVIPDSVTSIGRAVFAGCRSLTSVTIPESVTSIGYVAFYDTGIYNDESNWENNVLYISNCLIEAGESISGTYTIKENTRLIGDDAFYNCSSLTSITIPNSVTSIGDEAFSDCSSLTFITIPNSVTSIGGWAFSGCSSLSTITIPNSVTSIGEGAFKRCSSLTSIIFDGTIGEWNSVTKGNSWNYQVPATYVQCSDGQVTL